MMQLNLMMNISFNNNTIKLDYEASRDYDAVKPSHDTSFDDDVIE